MKPRLRQEHWREGIVVDDRDRDRFEETLEEVVEKSGWFLFAWVLVLMSNHYHFVFKTPEANLDFGELSRGRGWDGLVPRDVDETVQRPTQTVVSLVRGGRYKAIPVEDGDYLTKLIHYVHLNCPRSTHAMQYAGCSSASGLRTPHCA
jgi:hypothetical protein